MQRCVTAMVAAVVMTAGFASAGPTWTLNDDAWMSLNVLGQIHASYTDEAIDTTDVYLRRGRLVVAGQILDGAKFFVETDYDNAGRQGYDDVSMDIQDAFVDLRLGQSEHWVKAGLILLPFSFETHSSAASLLGLDYNSEVIKLPNSFVWRDYGVEAHGNIGSKFAYAVGAFDGYDTVLSNPESEVRLTGHVAVNLLGDVEAGWFNIQDRKGAAGNYLSLGLGTDYQAKASLGLDVPAGTGGTDATAFVADFQSGFALSETVGLTVNGAWYDWDSLRYDGNTAFVEAGVEEGQVMATVKFTHQDAAKLATQTDYTLGLHYFIKGHNLRTGIEYRWGDNRDFALVGIQFLL